MKALVATVLAICVTALAASAGIASAVSFDLDYSDPASDVVKLYTSNMTPVLLPSGAWSMSPFPDSVNLQWLRSANNSADVNLTFEVRGEIANLANTSYEMHLFTRADNASHFIVNYTNGVTWLKSNDTAFTPVDINGNSTIASTGPGPNPLMNKLEIRVTKSLLGAITSWNIDGTATQGGPVYTYRDFGWQVPGNPGSAPPPAPIPSSLPTWAWIALGLAIVAVLAVIVALVRRKRTPPPPK
jgi:hypothetical protein